MHLAVGAERGIRTRLSSAPGAPIFPGVRRVSQSDTSPVTVRVSDVFAALSFALDLAEGHRTGHSLRTCLIGLELAERLGLPLQDCRDLYYGLMLKDVGCSSTSARVYELYGGDDRVMQRRLMVAEWGHTLDALKFHFSSAAPGSPWWERAKRVASITREGHRMASELVETRSHRGAEIVRRLGFHARVADAVSAIDERWDGSGGPRGARGGEIPLLARIISLARVLEVFAATRRPAHALAFAQSRRGRWFDPTLVLACRGLEPVLMRWSGLDEVGLRDAVRAREPGDAALLAGPGTLDRIAQGFAEVVDAKSPFTAQHSSRVSELALAIAHRLGFAAADCAELKRAALLHDIGKLSVPNSVLDKPGPLDPQEWEQVRLHPYYTQRILEHIAGFERLATVAALHHERLDGRGYYHGYPAELIPLASQVIATADVYDALTAARPYRHALPEDVALELMAKDRGTGLRDDCLDALLELRRCGERIAPHAPDHDANGAAAAA